MVPSGCFSAPAGKNKVSNLIGEKIRPLAPPGASGGSAQHVCAEVGPVPRPGTKINEKPQGPGFFFQLSGNPLCNPNCFFFAWARPPAPEKWIQVPC